MRVYQGCGGVALGQGEIEDMEERRFGECDAFFFLEPFDFLFGRQGNEDVAVGDDAGCLDRKSVV